MQRIKGVWAGRGGPRVDGIRPQTELRDWANEKDIAMRKKEYRKPVLKTKKIKLGVFGSYSGRDQDTGDLMPVPIEVIDKLDLRME